MNRVAGESTIAVVAALVANLLIAIIKLVAGFVSGSASMFAEAAHSFSDVGNAVLLLVGIKRSGGAPSEKHPFGTAKSAYFWPFLVAVLLFGVAGAYSLFEGIEKTLHPHEVGDIRLALGVLGVAIVIETVSLTIAMRATMKAARARGIRSLREFIAENRDATLITVLVEDGLALAGLPIAAAALLLAKATGNPIWDAIGSIVIGALLMGFSLFLAAQVKSLLVGRGLSPRDLHRVRRVLEERPEVQAVVSLRSMYLGPQVVLLGAEVDLRDDLPATEVEGALARAEQALLETMPTLKYVYLEPVARPAGKPPGQVAAHG